MINLIKKPITLKAARNDSRYLNVNVNGNKKLVNNEKTAFIIWNISAVVTCPYATENCKKLCYALKAEKAYPSAKASRKANLEASKKADFVEKMIYTLSVEIERNISKGKKTVVRIHESGDFYNKEYFLKWCDIARVIKIHFGDNVVFMAYTKSVRYIVGADIPTNMSIRFSLWADTKKEEYDIAKSLHLPIYTASNRDILDRLLSKGFDLCECSDCANCGKCWDMSNKKIVVEIH